MKTINTQHVCYTVIKFCLSVWGTRTPLKVILKKEIKCKGQNVAMHSISKWSSAELYCSIFFWQCVRPYYCNRSQESLIHRGSQWEGKASWTIPVLGACGEIQRSVNPEPLSLLRAWDSGQCFTMAPVHWGERKGGRDKEREWREETDTEGEEEKRQRCSNRGRKTAKVCSEQNTITHKHIKNWLNIGVFIELSYKAGGTQEWVLISHNAYIHIYTSPHTPRQVDFTLRS